MLQVAGLAVAVATVVAFGGAEPHSQRSSKGASCSCFGWEDHGPVLEPQCIACQVKLG